MYLSSTVRDVLSPSLMPSLYDASTMPLSRRISV
jgi:hypothetical protein